MKPIDPMISITPQMTQAVKVGLSDPLTVASALATPGNCKKVNDFFSNPHNQPLIQLLQQDPERLIRIKNEMLTVLEAGVDDCMTDETSRKAIHNLKQVLASPGKFGTKMSGWGWALLIFGILAVASAGTAIGYMYGKRRTLAAISS